MTRLPFLRAAAALAVAAVSALAPASTGAQQTRWYLAEGSTGPFFEEEVLAINPTDQAATGIVRVYRDGTAVDVPIVIPPRRRTTLPVNLVPGLATGETSALVDTSASGVPIYVERTMYWTGRKGGHNAGAVEAPQTTWYLAEGATNSFFSTFILLVNPNPSAVSVTVRILRDDGAPVDFPYTVAANSRLTIPVNELPQFSNANFATVVTASQPVFVERAMYWSGFRGGHDATAVSALSSTWRFAEGFTGGDFETYFLLANPSASPLTATLTFFLDNGNVITKAVPVAANSRRTVRVRDYADLVNAAFATRITSTAPIVAERAMYWGGFIEGHDTAGLTSEATKWAFAEGLAGTFNGVPYETFYLFLNASASPIAVTGSFYREDGFGTRQTYTIPANSRFTLYGAAVPAHGRPQVRRSVREHGAVHRRARRLLGGRSRRGPRLHGRGLRRHPGDAVRRRLPRHPHRRRHRPRRRRRRARSSSATTSRAHRSANCSAAASTASASSSPTIAPASSTPCRRSPRASSSTSSPGCAWPSTTRSTRSSRCTTATGHRAISTARPWSSGSRRASRG